MATTYNNLYLDIRQRLRAAGIESATLEARELVCFGTGKSRRNWHAPAGCMPPRSWNSGCRSWWTVTWPESRWLISSENGSFTDCRWTFPRTC